MKLGIMQPYFLPYLGYWQLINAVDTFVIYDDVAFIKGGWINRNNFLINGQANTITIPLKNLSSFRKINEIEVLPNIKNKFLKTIQMAYARAPYFSEVMPLVQNIFSEYITISDLNCNSIYEVNKYLNIKTKIIISSDIDKDNSLKGQEKVIHTNKILKSDSYINAIGGMELYDKETFAQNGIKLNFIKMGDIKYKQFNNSFVPSLSILDVMMFNPPEKIKEMLDDYTLI